MGNSRHRESLPGITLGALWLALVLVGTGAVLGQGEDPRARVTEGNAAYEKGDYAEAIEIYRGVLDTGLRSSDLYYNLGNAYLKSGQLGWAVLNYERAARLDPRDEDVRANLEYARSRMVDVVPGRNTPWLLAVLGRAHNLLTLRQQLWLGSGLWFVIAGLGIVSLYRERLRFVLRTINLVLAAVLAVSLVSLGLKIYDREARHPGVVVADEVQVMSGPGEEYSREFVLHAGTRVEIKRSYQSWNEVALSDQMRGWIAADAVEGI